MPPLFYLVALSLLMDERAASMSRGVETGGRQVWPRQRPALAAAAGG